MAKKTKFSVAFPTLIFWCALLFTQRSLMPLIPFCAAILHEFGHFLAMKICGKNIEKITLYPFGIDIKARGQISSYRDDVFICISGVVVNITLAFILLLFPRNVYTELFISSNIIFAIINLLPIKTLDGGELVEKALYNKIDSDTAEKICSALSLVTIILLGSFAVWIFFESGYNFILLFMCIYLFCSAFVK